MSMRQKFLTEYKNTFNFKFMQDLQATYFPQVEKHFQVAMLDIYFHMYDIKIVEARYNPKNTNFAISQSKPNLRIDLEDCDFYFAFNYTIKSTPELLTDNGTARAWLKDMNLTVKASPSVSKTFVQFDFEQL